MSKLEPPAPPFHPGSPHPALAARDEDGKLVLNTRTLVFAGLALLSGGGVSLAVPRAALPPEVIADIAAAKQTATETKKTTDDVKEALTDLKSSVAQINQTLRHNAEGYTRLEGIVDRHEVRLQAVERRLR